MSVEIRLTRDEDDAILSSIPSILDRLVDSFEGGNDASK